MSRINVTIVNLLGLHARASAKLSQCASKFKSDIFISRNGQEVNAKSIMGVMMLGAAQGTEIELRAEGEDADEALKALSALIADRFGEDE